jgi:hypothetical protein
MEQVRREIPNNNLTLFCTQPPVSLKLAEIFWGCLLHTRAAHPFQRCRRGRRRLGREDRSCTYEPELGGCGAACTTTWRPWRGPYVTVAGRCSTQWRTRRTQGPTVRRPPGAATRQWVGGISPGGHAVFFLPRDHL